MLNRKNQRRTSKCNILETSSFDLLSYKQTILRERTSNGSSVVKISYPLKHYKGDSIAA